MRSIKFPNMFSSTNTNVWRSEEYVDATKQNTLLLLKSERGELFGDPYFGVLLKKYLFEQNNYILKDIIIDVIYKQIALFIPQIKINRNDIDIFQSEGVQRGKLICRFTATSLIDFTLNTYNLTLLDLNDQI